MLGEVSYLYSIIFLQILSPAVKKRLNHEP
jgi:hypothetical protein